MIDKIFPAMLMEYKPRCKPCGEMQEYILACKERYKQYHPEETISKVAGTISNEDAEEMLAAFYDDSNKLPPMHQQEIKPHKCVVCEGDGSRFKSILTGVYRPRSFNGLEALKEENCHACKGTGVLWG